MVYFVTIAVNLDLVIAKIANQGSQRMPFSSPSDEGQTAASRNFYCQCPRTPDRVEWRDAEVRVGWLAIVLCWRWSRLERSHQDT